MKWGIVILLVLGIIAAACATLLVSVMGTSSATARNPQSLEILVAGKSLPAMSVVTVDDFVKQKVSKNELPQGYVSGPTRVIGRTLAVPVVEGQVLTEACFVPDGTGAILASQLPEGMRAFTVNLNSRAVPDQVLLYPSCVVDVLFSAKLSRDARGEAVSATILQGIRVLAVQGESVVSNPTAEEDKDAKPRTRTGMVQVTLLVNQKQAEALQLAVDNGTISLAFRNPLDKRMGETDATVLNQGQLANLSSLLTPEILAAAQKAKQREEEEREWLESQIVASSDPNATPQAAPSGMPGFAPASQDYQAPKSPRWGITVIRGTQTKTEEFDLSGSETGEK